MTSFEVCCFITEESFRINLLYIVRLCTAFSKHEKVKEEVQNLQLKLALYMRSLYIWQWISVSDRSRS